MQPKTQIVINHIAATLDGWELSGWVIWKIAAETSVARSTVYKAIKKLKDMGAIESKVFTRRQWVNPDELYPFAFEDKTLFLTEKRIVEMTTSLITTQAAIWSAIQWGEKLGYFERMNGGSYGYMVRCKEVKNAA